MKVLAVIVVCFAYVAARGSGPYLPSGWKPDGPAFYLPSEVKPLDNPVKEEIYQESEASGSDSLLEYGPPKLQEVSQELSRQGLPDEINEQLFADAVVESATREGTDAVVEVTEQKAEVTDVKSEEAVAITESQAVAEAESVSNAESETSQANSESTTVENVVDSEAVSEISYIEPTAAVETVQERANNEDSPQSLEYTALDTKEGASNQESEQAVNQAIEESAVTAQVAGQESSGVTEQTFSSAESSAAVSQQAELKYEVVSTVEEKIETVEEEVKKVEQVVQNIPELLINLENEVKAQQAEAIQEIPAVVEQTLGSLEQAPEGFLEYGPPGFREYGPPNVDLRDNTIEEQQQVASNDARRRRFSPKFRPSRKH